MEVDVNTKQIHIPYVSDWCSKPKLPKLYEQQKATVASNSDNEYITPFKITVENLNTYMLNKDRELLTLVIKNIKHHYKTYNSAKHSISEMIRQDVIKGFYLSKCKNKIYINKKPIF
jgi:hypothetical protein